MIARVWARLRPEHPTCEARVPHAILIAVHYARTRSHHSSIFTNCSQTKGKSKYNTPGLNQDPVFIVDMKFYRTVWTRYFPGDAEPHTWPGGKGCVCACESPRPKAMVRETKKELEMRIKVGQPTMSGSSNMHTWGYDAEEIIKLGR